MRTLTLISAISCALAAAAALAGDLNPPAGVVAPTMRTLDQVEPRTIVNQQNTPGDATATYIIKLPGSYYLTSNLAGQDGKHGIIIQSLGVTLDLMGFELRGPGPAGGSTQDGIFVDSEAAASVVIRNGTIREWGGSGINANLATSSVIEHIVSHDNTGSGIIIGDDSRITDCTANENGDEGFDIGRLSHARHCIANRNGSHGFLIDDDCLVIDCAASVNAADGFNADTGVRIERCLSSQNGSNGMDVNERCTVINCTVDWNDMAGIGTDQSWCRFIGNTITRHSFMGSSGIFISGSQSVVDGNTISEVTTGITISTGTRNCVMRNRITGFTTAISAPANNDVAPVTNTFTGAGPWDNLAD